MPVLNFHNWACPVCHTQLAQFETFWSCTNKHCFDIAKSGYINLLLAHQKASKQPGDSPQMLQARRDFLEAQHFRPISDALANCINRLSPKIESTERSLLDMGCGEGYYLRQLRSELTGVWQMAGLDIAKDGVNMAAKVDKEITWVCASNARLPIMTKSVDVLLRIFAPSDPAEAHRVLKDDGTFIIVTPGAKHLYEIKQAIYKHAEEHSPPTIPEGFEKIAEQQVSFSLSLKSSTEIKSLLAMTPYLWQGQAKGREHLLGLTHFDVQIDVAISNLQKST